MVLRAFEERLALLVQLGFGLAASAGSATVIFSKSKSFKSWAKK